MTVPSPTLTTAPPGETVPPERAHDFAARAMTRMRDETVPPTPENYAVFYSYYARRNSDLVRAMDTISANGYSFDARRCQQLYDEFISNSRETKTVQSVSTELEKLANEVLATLDAAGLNTQRFGSMLQTAQTGLTTELPGELLRALVSQMAKETARMLVENTKLQGDLKDNGRRMEVLKRDLDSVRTETRTDALTGIPNRRAFDERLREVISTSGESGQPLSLLMVDIDHFKKFNDTHGHQTGDMVLKLVARTLRTNIRDTDLAARYGGEEFGLILPGTAAEGAMIVANKLVRLMVEKKLVNRRNGEDLGTITVSIGCAQLETGELGNSFVERADKALYAAKRSGRNRAVVWEPGL